MPSLIRVLRAPKAKNQLFQECFVQLKNLAKIRLLSRADKEKALAMLFVMMFDSCIVFLLLWKRSGTAHCAKVSKIRSVGRDLFAIIFSLLMNGKDLKSLSLKNSKHCLTASVRAKEKTWLFRAFICDLLISQRFELLCRHFTGYRSVDV